MGDSLTVLLTMRVCLCTNRSGISTVKHNDYEMLTLLQPSNKAKSNKVHMVDQANKLKTLEKLRRANAFSAALKQVNSLTKQENERILQQSQALKAAGEKRENTKRIIELKNVIAHLRQELAINNYDGCIQSKLAMAEAELYALMLSI